MAITIDKLAAGKVTPFAFLGHGIAGPTLALAGDTLGSFLGNFAREASYAGNRTGYPTAPPPDSIIRSYYAGKYGQPNTDDAKRRMWESLADHAIFKDAELEQSVIRATGWINHVSLEAPLPSLETFLRAWRLGGFKIKEDDVDNILVRNGVWQPDYQKLAKFLPEPLTIQEIFLLWSAGIIDDADVKKLLAVAGQPDEKQQNWLMQLFEVPDLAQSLVLRNREVIDDDELQDYLGRLGYRRDDEKVRLASLRFEIPGPSDLVRFAVRHVFEPSLAAKFGFNAEISDDFIEWHKKQGFGQQFTITDPVTKDKFDINWAQAHWWAHWVWPAPTQAYTMLHRLRPTGGINGGPRDPSGLVFDQTDLNYLLRGNDYPPHWRPYLATVSYRVIESQQIKELQNTGLIEADEAKERYQDVGYQEKDAKLLVKLTNAENEWKQIQRMLSRVRFKVIASYREGVMSRQDASIQLYALSIANLRDYAEYKAKSHDEQLQIAQNSPITQSTLDLVDTELKTQLSKAAIHAVHQSYLKLEINEQQAQQILQEIGVFANRAKEYLDLWKWEFFGRGKSLAVGQITKAITRGVLLPQAAIQRLVRLGYTTVDAYALILMASQDRIAYLNRAAIDAARTRAKQQKALLEQQKMLKQQLRENQAALAKSAPRSKLIKWYVAGYIPKAEFELRLALLGVSKEDIGHELQAAIDAHNKKQGSKKTVKTGP